MQALSPSNIAVAKRLGIHEGQIIQLLIGRAPAGPHTGRTLSGAAAVHQQHARFAAACMLNELLCEVPAWHVAQEWGLPQKLTAAGQLPQSQACLPALDGYTSCEHTQRLAMCSEEGPIWTWHSDHADQM